jgi:hypothetical protein
MADGLLQSGALVGKSRASVIEMLGPPTETGKWKDWDLVYWLGAERSLISIDSEWLVIRFISSDRVAEVRLVRD